MKQEKTTGLKKKKGNWENMKWWKNDELCKLDWIISSIVLIILYFTCIQGDLLLTGNRSFLMYEHFWDFYKASYEQSKGYFANYLPSTFLVYALWNLPLYIIGHVPQAMLTNSFINNMWYKLLPVILYYVTAHVIYKIGIEVGFGEKKARLCKFAFLVFPIGVFSQFIFSQYDIFTVFFMIMGLYFFLKNNMWKFALFFGIAVTFKYHALLYFLVLLVLKEKKIRDLIKYSFIMAIPILVEVLPNIGSIYFQKNVMGFGVLKFVQRNFSFGFFNGINLVATVVAFILVWSYQKKANDEQQLFSWAIFYTTAMSFAIFGFASWNPQWLLLMVPFLILNIFINENGNMLLMVTNIFILALYIFCSQNLVGEGVLNYGILKYFLPSYEYPIRMWDLYMYHNEDMLCSAMWVVLLIYVIFGQPKYYNRKGTIISKGLVWQIRSAFIFGVLAYVIPMILCVIAMFQGWTVFYDNTRRNLEKIVTIEDDEYLEQNIISDGNEIKDIKVRVAKEKPGMSKEIEITIREQNTNNIIYHENKNIEKFENNSGIYSILDKSVKIEPGKIYTLGIKCKDEGYFGVYCLTNEDSQEQLLKINSKDEVVDSQIQMKVIGIR